MGRELEWKFSADRAILDAAEREHPGGWRQIVMETRYLDTPRGDFAARRWTFRQRMENGRSVYCLKTPGSGEARGEWEWQGDDAAAAVEQLTAAGAPAELRQLTDGRDLREICGASFIRRCLTVALGKAQAEVALDDGVLRGGGKEVPLCEIEVEHKEGDEETTRRFAGTVASTYDLTALTESKFARANALAKTV